MCAGRINGRAYCIYFNAILQAGFQVDGKYFYIKIKIVVEFNRLPHLH